MWRMLSDAFKKNYKKIIGLLIFLTPISILLIYIKLGLLISIKSLFYFIPTIIFLIIILKYKNNFFDALSTSLKDLVSIPNIFSKNLHQIFLLNLLIIILSFSILIRYPTRNLLYLLLVSLSGTLLFSQVVFTEQIRPLYFFTQAIPISLGLTWGVTMKYPLFFGYSDIIPHISFVSTVIQKGISALPKNLYQYFPLYHTFLAMGKIILGLPLKISYFLLLGLIPICFLFLPYLISIKIIKDQKMSLIICLFFLFNREVIFGSRYLVTRNLAVIFMLYILYLIIRKGVGKASPKFTMVILIFTFSLIFTHHITTLFFVIILVIIILINVLLKNSGAKILKKYLLFLIAISSAYLLFVSQEFTLRLYHAFKESLHDLFSKQIFQMAGGTSENSSTIMMALRSILGNLDYMVIIFFSLFGILFILFKRQAINKNVKIFLTLGVFSLPFVIPNPILLQLNADFLLYRIPMVTIIFWIFLPVIGFLIFFHTVHLTNRNLSFLLHLAVFYLICFTAVANANTASDVPEISKISNSERIYFNASELSCLKFLNSLSSANFYNLISDRYCKCYAFSFFKSVSHEKEQQYFLIRPGFDDELPSIDYNESNKIYDTGVLIYIP